VSARRRAASWLAAPTSAAAAALGRADEAREWLAKARELRPGPAEDADTLEQLRQLGASLGA